MEHLEVREHDIDKFLAGSRQKRVFTPTQLSKFLGLPGAVTRIELDDTGSVHIISQVDSE